MKFIRVHGHVVPIHDQQNDAKGNIYAKKFQGKQQVLKKTENAVHSFAKKKFDAKQSAIKKYTPAVKGAAKDAALAGGITYGLNRTIGSGHRIAARAGMQMAKVWGSVSLGLRGLNTALSKPKKQ